MKYILFFFCFFNILNANINERLVKIAISSHAHTQVFSEASGKLFFSNSFSSNNEKIWVTDGTIEGTKGLEEFSNFPKGERSFFINDDLDKLILTNYKGLWSTDGTDLGTQKIANHNLISAPSYFISNKENKNVLNDKILLEAYDILKRDILITDGTLEGTNIIFRNIKTLNLIKTSKLKDSFIIEFESDEKIYFYYSIDINTLDTLNFLTSSNRLFFSEEHNGKLYYVKTETDSTVALWSTEGTKESNKLITKLSVKLKNQTPTFKLYKDKLYFTIQETDDISSLWETDGTSEGTQRIVDISLSGAMFRIKFFDFNNKLIITNELIESAYWITDGTKEGTIELVDRNYGNQFTRGHTVIKNRLFTIKNDNLGKSIPVITDGTKDGTKEILIPGLKNGMINFPVLHNYRGDHAIFEFNDNEGMTNLVVTDGSNEGTFIVDRFAMQDIQNNDWATIFEEYVIYSKYNELNSKFMMCSFNLKTSERKELKPTDATTNLAPEKLPVFHIFKNDLYFFAEYYQNEVNLWKIEGTQTSVEDTPQLELMTVYPNPAKDFIQLELSKPMHLSIVNSAGKIVKDFGVIADGKLNVTELISGVYFVVDEQGNNIAKFVKE